MASESTRKYCRQLINHPYVGLQILPLIGDFVSHSKKVNKALLRDEAIDEDEFDRLNSLATRLERSENYSSFKELLRVYKSFR